MNKAPPETPVEPVESKSIIAFAPDVPPVIIWSFSNGVLTVAKLRTVSALPVELSNAVPSGFVGFLRRPTCLNCWFIKKSALSAPEVLH